MIKLYDYYRSTACYRVRIALHLKKISYETIPVHLTKDGGEHHHSNYLQINPQGLVPTLEINTHKLHQSIAIIEYLEEVFPEIPLLPKEAPAKATVRALASIIACDIHPLNNLRVLERLKEQYHMQEVQKTLWYHHWLKTGFDAIETLLAQIDRSQLVCAGDHVSIADVFLIPQVYNALRFDFPMHDYPLINAINAHCLQLPAFQQAAPDNAQLTD